MFDSVLDRGSAPKSAFGRGTVVSVLVHVGLVLFAIWFSSRPPDEDKKETEVTFFAAPPPPPPPPPPAGNTPKVEKKTEPKKKPIKKPDTIVQPKDPEKQPEPQPEEQPEEEQPEEEPQQGGQEGGVVGGVEGGVVGGVVGGKVGGQLGGTGTEVLPFGEGMSRPERLEGRDPEFTREAREAHVEGLAIVKCTIMTDGTLQNCRIVKPLPFMEQAILDALKTWRMKPVTFQGRPVNVDYVIQLRLKLR